MSAIACDPRVRVRLFVEIPEAAAREIFEQGVDRRLRCHCAEGQREKLAA
jgi:hypothetical protein